MTRKFASMPVKELWEIYEEISKLFEAKMLAEKKMLKRRLSSLLPAMIDLNARRPYPPVVPKFANPGEPSQVWSGRGKRPRWVTEKLASGLALEDLSIGRRSSVAMHNGGDKQAIQEGFLKAGGAVLVQSVYEAQTEHKLDARASKGGKERRNGFRVGGMPRDKL